MPFYEGPPLLRYLETVPIARDRSVEALRFPVQHVLRPDLDFRGFSGTVAGGVLRRGASVMSLPSRRTSTVARIVTYDGDREEAFAPQAVTVTLTDEIDVSRGDMLVAPDALPHVDRRVEAMVVWMHETPLRPGASYLLKHGTKVVSAEVVSLHERVDVNTLERRPAAALALNDIGRVTLAAARPLLFDAYAESRATGAFILIDRLTNGTYGAGMILGPGAPAAGGEEAGEHGQRGVSLDERLRRFGQQRAAVVVLRGDDAAEPRPTARAHVLEQAALGRGVHGARAGAQRGGGARGLPAARAGLISIVRRSTATGSCPCSAAPWWWTAHREASVEDVLAALRRAAA